MLYLVCMILEGSLLYQSFNADDVREERCMKDKHYDLKTPLLCRCASNFQTPTSFPLPLTDRVLRRHHVNKLSLLGCTQNQAFSFFTVQAKYTPHAPPTR
jgi:hypothetical protein